MMPRMRNGLIMFTAVTAATLSMVAGCAPGG